MKVILLEDVKSVGRKDEIVEVNDAYARNVLFRRNAAVEATGKNMNDLKLRRANNEKVAAENLAAAEELKQKIEKSRIVLKVKVGENGKLFGSISNAQIADAMKEQLGIEVDKKKITCNPIKSVGSMTAAIRLHTKVSADRPVEVESL